MFSTFFKVVEPLKCLTAIFLDKYDCFGPFLRNLLGFRQISWVFWPIKFSWDSHFQIWQVWVSSERRFMLCKVFFIGNFWKKTCEPKREHPFTAGIYLSTHLQTEQDMRHTGNSRQKVRNFDLKSLCFKLNYIKLNSHNDQTPIRRLRLQFTY